MIIFPDYRFTWWQHWINIYWNQFHVNVISQCWRIANSTMVFKAHEIQQLRISFVENLCGLKMIWSFQLADLNELSLRRKNQIKQEFYIKFIYLKLNLQIHLKNVDSRFECRRFWNSKKVVRLLHKHSHEYSVAFIHHREWFFLKVF